MPITAPNLDDRRYDQLVEETLARVPVHTPEWTNFNASDPGVTIVQLFAFLTESLLYRANQIPERNRRKFLELLRVPLAPASAAKGIITVINERGPLESVALPAGVEGRAAKIAFRSDAAFDVLPIEALVCYKRKVTPPEEVIAYYQQLYASYFPEQSDSKPALYEVARLADAGPGGVDIAAESVDQMLWIALLARKNDSVAAAREKIAGRTLSLGIAPVIDDSSVQRRLRAGGAAAAGPVVEAWLPLAADGKLGNDRKPQYVIRERFAAPSEPEVVNITLPSAAGLQTWNDLEPLEAGADGFPPTLEDTDLNERVVTWLQLRWPEGAPARLLWADINAAFVRQRVEVQGEILPTGTGTPDQQAALSRRPVLAESVKIKVGGEWWTAIDDLLAAGPEVPEPDLLLPPGAKQPLPKEARVFALDAEAGVIRFGDGLRGKRPPRGAVIRAYYDYAEGREGNVGAGAINAAPALPAGFKVSNPLRTWGGADAETTEAGEKQITRFLQHRERLVTAEDFETITLRTPGVEIGRIEVLSAFAPSTGPVAADEQPDQPGGAPGAVTLMLIPKTSPTSPAAPEPDALFLDAVCDYLDSRRLVTTELILDGPDYHDIWVTIGFTAVAGNSVVAVREAIERRIRDFLSPLPVAGGDPCSSARHPKGWPLFTAVIRAELLAEASRTPGVASILSVRLAAGTGGDTESVPMRGLQLPRLAGLDVAEGTTPELEQLRGAPSGGAPSTNPPAVVPVPFIPKEC